MTTPGSLVGKVVLVSYTDAGNGQRKLAGFRVLGPAACRICRPDRLLRQNRPRIWDEV